MELTLITTICFRISRRLTRDQDRDLRFSVYFLNFPFTLTRSTHSLFPNGPQQLILRLAETSANRSVFFFRFFFLFPFAGWPAFEHRLISGSHYGNSSRALSRQSDQHWKLSVTRSAISWTLPYLSKVEKGKFLSWLSSHLTRRPSPPINLP